VVRVPISLPEPLLEKAKRLAAERGITMSALVQDALRQLSSRKPASSSPAFMIRRDRRAVIGSLGLLGLGSLPQSGGGQHLD